MVRTAFYASGREKVNRSRVYWLKKEGRRSRIRLPSGLNAPFLFVCRVFSDSWSFVFICLFCFWDFRAKKEKPGFQSKKSRLYELR